MTGIHCANCVQMWGWVSRITHILSCLHECLQTISNFQIALSFFFSWRSDGNCGQISMLPGWWRGTLLGKEVFSCLAPQRGWRKREREERAQHTQSCGCTPSLCGGCPSLLPQGWIPTCAHRAGQRASRTVTIPCPHPKLHNVTCPSYVLLCTCGCLCCTVKPEEKAKPGYTKVG